jgi:hypothetical protein
MNDFTRLEELGRTCFQNAYPNYTKDYSTKKYDWYDVSGYTTSDATQLKTSQPYVAEIKVRENLKHDSYDTVMLEVQKYENLINYTLQSGIPSFYFCVYKDKTLVANISSIEVDKIVRKDWWLPVYTAADDGNKLKDIYEVPLKYFKVLNKGVNELNEKRNG